MNKINDGAKWDDAALAGERIGRHYRSLAESADPAATAPLAVEAERFSRVALTFSHREGDEPAEVLRKFRWQKMFASQALRTVQDHWYDENPTAEPYYTAAARSFLADARTLIPTGKRDVWSDA